MSRNKVKEVKKKPIRKPTKQEEKDFDKEFEKQLTPVEDIANKYDKLLRRLADK